MKQKRKFPFFNNASNFEVNFIPEPNTGCWLWLGSMRNKSYGSICWQGRRTLAHRVSYEIYKGKIPKGKSLDHLCRNTFCVNPEHLEPVSHLENIRRSTFATKTQCIHGHFYADGFEYYIRPDTGTRYRRCLTCYKMRFPNTSKI